MIFGLYKELLDRVFNLESPGKYRPDLFCSKYVSKFEYRSTHTPSKRKDERTKKGAKNEKTKAGLNEKMPDLGACPSYATIVCQEPIDKCFAT